MKLNHFIPLGIILLFAALTLLFHTSTFTPVTGWLPQDGRELRVEMWQQKTPLLTAQTRLVLRERQSGGLRAVSPAGYMSDVDCAALDACRISFYSNETYPEAYGRNVWALRLTSAGAPVINPDNFDKVVPTGFPLMVDANNMIGPNICFANVIYTLSWVLSAIFASLLLATAMRAQIRWRDFYGASIAALPVLAAFAMIAQDTIISAERAAMAATVGALCGLPLWGIAALYHRRLLRNPQKPLARRVVIYAFLAVFLLAFPFIQNALQGSIREGDSLLRAEDLQLDTTPEDQRQ